ncbi:MAG: hypothetical protein DHS20C18_19560 [Saprospiraceae bacterium]|nr:MAG: hypothetical protein DHS20C18_19560 [Saprospiraceae bacterium]
MPESLQTAFLLLVVGMVTVFVVLSLVVFTGRSIIWIVNRYYVPEETINAISGTEIAPKKVAAIVAAVEIFTNGQGKIDTINPQ